MTLDPKDWPAFRKTAHAMLDASLDKMQSAREGHVWSPVPKALKAEINSPLPQGGISEAQMQAELEAIMPYAPGNTHPRFFGWVNGAGAPSNILAEISLGRADYGHAERDDRPNRVGDIHGDRNRTKGCAR